MVIMPTSLLKLGDTVLWMHKQNTLTVIATDFLLFPVFLPVAISPGWAKPKLNNLVLIHTWWWPRLLQEYWVSVFAYSVIVCLRTAHPAANFQHPWGPGAAFWLQSYCFRSRVDKVAAWATFCHAIAHKLDHITLILPLSLYCDIVGYWEHCLPINTMFLGRICWAN